MDGLLLITICVTGLCVAGMTVSLRGPYARLVGWIEADLRGRLRSLRLSLDTLRWRIHLWLALLLMLFLLMWLGFDSVLLGGLAVVLLAVGPWYLVHRAGIKRKQQIEDQMADALVMFSSAVRAGLSLAQAIALLADECPQPIKQEFQQMISEYRLGKPLERMLTEAKSRLKSENFALFAAALLASRESGGKLNDTVERVARSVVEHQRLERKMLSETAQARKSAIYMAIVPALLLVVYWFVDPLNTRLLFVTLPGQLLLCIAILLNVAAYLWALKILRADF